MCVTGMCVCVTGMCVCVCVRGVGEVRNKFIFLSFGTMGIVMIFCKVASSGSNKLHYNWMSTLHNSFAEQPFMQK